jgi:hypothetical protein
VTTPWDFPRPTSKPTVRPARVAEEEFEATPPPKAEQLTFGIETPAPSGTGKPGGRGRNKTTLDSPTEKPAQPKPRRTEKAMSEEKKSPSPRGRKSAAKPAKAKPTAVDPTTEVTVLEKPAHRSRNKTASEAVFKAPVQRKPSSPTKSNISSAKTLPKTDKNPPAPNTGSKGVDVKDPAAKDGTVKPTPKRSTVPIKPATSKQPATRKPRAK